MQQLLEYNIQTKEVETFNGSFNFQKLRRFITIQFPTNFIACGGVQSISKFDSKEIKIIQMWNQTSKDTVRL